MSFSVPKEEVASETRRVLVIGLCAAVLMGPTFGCSKAETPKVVIYTLLPYPILDQSVEGIKRGLAENGYGEGQATVSVVNANGQMNLLNAYAKEIIAGKPAIIVPVSTPVTQAVTQEAAPTQNIVFSTVTDITKIGMDKRPPNMTGVADLVDYAASIDLIMEMFPNTKKIGMVYNPSDDAAKFGVDKTKPLAAAKGLRLIVVPASNSDEVISAARSLMSQVDVFYVGSDNTVASAMAGVTAIAQRARVPVIASDAGSVEGGALAAVSVDYRKLGNTAGKLVSDVLRSGKAAGQFAPIIFRGDTLVVNTKTAEQLRYTIPPSVMARQPRLVSDGNHVR